MWQKNIRNLVCLGLNQGSLVRVDFIKTPPSLTFFFLAEALARAVERERGDNSQCRSTGVFATRERPQCFISLRILDEV